MSSTGTVDLHQEGRVGHLMLNRPDEHNLVTHGMAGQIMEHLQRAAGLCDVIAIRGAGEDFCMGRDQSERPEGVSGAEQLARIVEVNALLRGFDGVIVCAVQGGALGFGSGVVLHCDIAVAAESAQFGFDEIAHGFPPLIVEAYLPRYMHLKLAADLVLSGRRLTAAEAFAAGMVARVVDAGRLDSEFDALVAQLAASNPAALSRAKRFFEEIDHVPADERAAHGLSELVAWRQSQAS